MQGAQRGVVGIDVVHDQLAGLLIDHVPPQALQEPLGSHHRPGLPGLRLCQRAHAHLVQPEGVSAIGLVHLVRGDDVLQRFAHLPVFTFHSLAMPGPRGPVPLPVGFDLGRRHRLPAGIAVGVGLDVALVEEPAEWFGGGDVPQVEQHLVPEPGVQQMQHGVFDAADVQIDTADVALAPWAHPVTLHLLVDEAVVVLRIQVAHLVPAGAGPLRHHVQLTTVGLQAVTQIQLDGRPASSAGQGRHRVGVPVLRVQGLRGVVSDLGQLHWQHRLGQRDGQPLVVVDDREGLAPVALAAEQPVPELVGDGCLAQTFGFQPPRDGGLRLGDIHAVERDLGVSGVDDLAVARPG